MNILVNCPICDSQSDKKNELYLLELISSSTWECSKCGVFFRNPLPDSGHLEKYYSQKYFRWPKRVERKIANLQSEWIINRLISVGINSFDLSYVEFGAGRGWLVDRMSKYSKSAIGFEADITSANWGKKNLGVELHNSFLTLENISSLEKSGTLIFSLSHVLEHLIDPKNFLTELKKYDDSLIFIEVPNALYEGQGMALDISPSSSMGQHFWSFTTRSLKLLLESAGYQLLIIEELGGSKYYESYINAMKLQCQIKQEILEMPFGLKKFTFNVCRFAIRCLFAGLKIKLETLLTNRYSRINAPVIRVIARAVKSDI
jgi:2-polyprenyl-3-methyl-5-hydroxy-6-metoxy-1,4-benzoquinol methylase